MLIVLDTNVLVSGMINAQGTPGRIVDLLRDGEVELVTDDRILDEYLHVLRRPYFKRYFSHAAREDVISYLENNTMNIVANVQVPGLPDESDRPFAETALVADVPLVTGNMRHFPKSKCRGLKALSPKAFLDLLADSGRY